MFINACLKISLVAFVLYILWFLFFCFKKTKNLPIKKGNLIYELFIMMPLLNEEKTVSRYISKLNDELDKVDETIIPNIVLIDDDSDDQTLKELNKYANTLKIYQRTKIHILNRKKPNAQTGKGDVLNFGINYISKLPHTLSEKQIIIGIIDADGFISHNDINDIIGTFEKNNISMVQCSVGMFNKKQNWLSKMQDLEFMGNNAFMQECRNIIGQAIASGNGQFVTLKMAEDVKWGKSLLEDLEFTLRGLFKNHRALFLPSATVYQEAVPSLKPLIVQRVRWCQGSMQCLFKYGKEIMINRLITPAVKFDLVLLLILPFCSMLLNIANIVTLLVQLHNALTGHLISTIFILSTIAILSIMVWLIVLKKYLKITKDNFKFSHIITIIECMAYNILLSFVPYISFKNLLKKNNSWAKTSHGQVELDVEDIEKL
ncbi:glycosyltransferase family 2 protein [Companilactobacillus versmoldensis]|uniref:Family 2 glycosyl transferase n=1 Tax=Companilactobacillus versmoldensis DSM 14857 = KCTC 3814 TaxID=1423815 RepID=A0A0R1SJ55_9LACO|nr:glycosyltransferase family 2 protein [Companilactobacillus versmoldensis]KRL67588.1 family 2 glycosyl transferase [Companilactobacillus versmoldensis DSM 14857 = KCTC 3814]